MPWHVLRLALHLLLGPGCLRSPWGGVVRNFSQGHGDGHPLVAMPLTEPSPVSSALRSPLRCQQPWSTSKGTTKIANTKWSNLHEPCVVVVVVVVVRG